MIELRGVGLIRGERQLLDAIDLAIEPGEVIALVGPNGAGKSTLLSVLAGDLAPSSGSMHLDGRRIQEWSIGDLARILAMLPQQTVLQFGFTGEEVVAMGRTPLPVAERRRDAEAIGVAMRETESLHFASRRFPTLSGGEQTRVSLSRVLAQETRMLLLDEPTAALDIRHQQLVMQRARTLADTGRTVIAILHDLNLAMSHADRLAILADGRLVAVERPWGAAREGLLESVFQCPLIVARHPHLGCPLVLPMNADLASTQF
ncbi:MAG TPA: heme ABC transporter ATP-binding protein [Thermomicrobiales bacterium]|nr:heme ABC transporter ATP-binding protein [Thermomicrobiales bacterium]